MSRILPLLIIILILIIIVLPAVVVRGCRPLSQPGPMPLDRRPIDSPAGEIILNVFRPELGACAQMPLEEYLVGVVAAEMPASFDPEALKAQAVVARTYTVNQMLQFGGKGCDKHAGADICTDSTHCQAWEIEEFSLRKWPAAEAAAYMNKIRNAVRETAGQVALYDDSPIDAVYHSTCGGHTEDSEKVWSAALPYLRGVPCEYCAGTRWWRTEHVFTGSQFAKAILPYVSAIPVSAAGRPLLSDPILTVTGRVSSLRVAGENVSGRDLRKALDLPSTHFSWRFNGDNVIFTNRGYGHGVGLCQYGADGMAKAGKSYKEIISHYYSGAEVRSISSISSINR